MEPLNVATVRYKTAADGAWQPATAVARRDFEAQTYDWLQLKEGAWPADGGVGVERITSDYYGINLGDEIYFEFEGTDLSLIHI